MDARTGHLRELTVLAITIVGLSRLLDGPLTWLVAAILLAAVGVGARQVLAEGERIGHHAVPFEASIVPAVAAVGALGAIRLVPLGLALIPALIGAGVLLEVAIGLEARAVDRPGGPSVDDRRSLLATALVAGFLAFTGVAAMVTGGLADPGAGGSQQGPPVTEQAIVALALVDAFVAGLLGYRFAAMRLARPRDALWAAGTYAGAIAVGAGFLRVVAIPRLLGPALLVLVFYLWDAVRGTAPSLRRDPRFIWQTIILVGLAIVVIAWNTRLQG